MAQTAGCVDINGPSYCPEETLAGGGPNGGAGGAGGLTKAQLLKRCKAKAQTKFGDNRPKKKAAIRKCKKKYR